MLLSNRSVVLSLTVILAAALARSALAFTAAPSAATLRSVISSTATTRSSLFLSSEDFTQETPEATKERIEALIENHPVLLFMKGSKLFPQCGFSNTASQILNSFNIDYHTVDVLSDEAIRQGIKDYSQWPTIPQLYVCGEFIGGSDIMIEMYQTGELGEMIEKAKADMI
ncbi:glutaredoxin [Nitzschia inconspicua]|uniref:Glutaredoxin n=1 Tax=Nitzschia inconspicua TaxID=303405 RepID=A0A9K3KF25_9STRA|nr:glutaredoxin [Nitzschia inconspicua]KAG7363068.1 glutaredoxin [Nitzschia inconspicua]